MATTNLQYLKKAYDENEKLFVKKNHILSHLPSGRHVSYAADVKDSDLNRSPLASRESSLNRGPADYVCFNCGMAGDHYTRYCTNERQEMCTRCRTLGLSNATCPCDSKNADNRPEAQLVTHQNNKILVSDCEDDYFTDETTLSDGKMAIPYRVTHAKGFNQSLRCSLKVGKIPIEAVFDTGASKNFISNQLYEKVKENAFKIKKNITRVKYILADNSIVNEDFRVCLPINIDDILWKEWFTVFPEMPDDMILGLNIPIIYWT
ncbi:hypothetical protein KQX54_000012 [Cotesia glomerata]|uniref:CCHC-type domain-containing protein n=1 Tax=Cotesia glomerata TaxID=32391 RepID=A0AAV7I5L8_COTGL|nr:hypothetical protein KQX54_000012 [Cotesia glomerata]